MEHLAKVLKEDPLEFRIKNMNTSDQNVLTLKQIIEELRKSSDYEDRLRQVSFSNCAVPQLLLIKYLWKRLRNSIATIVGRSEGSICYQ